MADKEKVSLDKPDVPTADEGLSLQDAGDIVALIDRLVETGGIKGGEVLRVGQLRTKLIALIQSAQEKK